MADIDAIERTKLSRAVAYFLNAYDPPEFVELGEAHLGGGVRRYEAPLTVTIHHLERDGNEAERADAVKKALYRLAYDIYLHHGFLIEPKVVEEDDETA